MPHRNDSGPVRVLLVEDSPEDAELIAGQLLDAGLLASFQRVEGSVEMRDALASFDPHIVLSDLSMPGFTGYEALNILREAKGNVPFIFVSGTIDEGAAVQALREGANDYIIKENTARLPSAVERALREARLQVERERAEKELMRAQRLESLAMLAAGLSHDLRNILQPLLIVPSLIAGKTQDPQLLRLADIVAECGRRGHEMAESMLSFVRGSTRLTERIEVAALFQGIKVLLESSLPGNVDLLIDEAGAGIYIDANYTEMQQCLLNLSLNAIQAMPSGGALRLLASEAGTGGQRSGIATISVRDEGIGMAPETLQRLFEPFFSTKQGGTGLGLASCKRIVEAYGGELEVNSVLGNGTRFDLHLPLATAEIPVATGEARAAAGRGQRVLVVDSEATRLSLLGNALASQGYRPVTAADGAAALRELRAGVLPDLVIVDDRIRLLSAASLLSVVRDMGYAGMAILLADAGTGDSSLAGLNGVDVRVLEKPLEMQSVFQAVADALAEPSTLQS